MHTYFRYNFSYAAPPPGIQSELRMSELNTFVAFAVQCQGQVTIVNEILISRNTQM